MNEVWLLELRKSQWQPEADLSFYVREEDCSAVLRVLGAKGWSCILRVYSPITPEEAADLFDVNDPRC